MTVLGIETATDVCSVGLVHGDAVFERSLRETRIHSEMLLTLLGQVLDEASILFNVVGGIALSSGPGSFTGLRIGAATVKGLVASHPMPCALVPTFDGIEAAYRAERDERDPLMICLDAKQDEWYVRQERGGQTEVLHHDVVLGRGVGNVILTDLPSRFPAGFRIFDVRPWCRGGTIAILGRAKLDQGQSVDVRSFEPAYRKEFRVQKRGES